MITIWMVTLLTTAVGIGTAPDAASPARASAVVRQQSGAAGYWTPPRMRAAMRNAWSDGDSLGSALRWEHGGAVARMTGKVFFTLDGTDYVCSGAAVGGDVVLTAAHCTGNGAGDWAANWTFVPGYAGGTAPYGSFAARRFYVPPQWAAQRGASSVKAEKYDVAFVTVNPSRPAGHGGQGRGPVRGGTGARRLGQVTRGLAVAFGSTPLNGRDTYVFGYPSVPPFSGQYPDFCAGRARQTAKDIANGAAAITCGMTAGDSGGPWITGFSPRTGAGVVVAVSTYKYSDGARMLYGTRLGREAERLYVAASAAG